MCNSCTCTCSKLSIEVGKTFITQHGGHIKIETKIGETYVGRLILPRPGNESNKGALYEFNKNGVSLIKNSSPYCTDLVKEHKEPEYRWFNVYGKGSSGHMVNANVVHFSLDAANEGASHGRIACIKVNIETGVAVNEKI